MEDQRDEHLWEIAKRRAKFQDNLVRYVVLVIILWGIWWLTGGRSYNHNNTHGPHGLCFSLEYSFS